VSGDDDFCDVLLDYIRDRKLVTVVGPDVTVVNVGSAEQTLSSLIGQRLAGLFPLTVSPEMTLDEAVTAFLRDHGREEVELQLYRVINNIIRELDAVPGNALRDLAAITDLRLFVSTTPDGLLARAMNEVRSRGRTRELTASSNLPTSQQPSDEPEPAATDTVVLSLFGRAASTRQYAIHEEDRLEWLRALVRDEASLPDWLTYRLRSQPMLFVGCEMPDWVGRFLLRMSSNTRLSLGGKQFFVVGSSSAYEKSLSNFFDTYCVKAQVQPLEMEPTAFVEKLRARWEEETQTPSTSPAAVDISGSPCPDASKIFISYMHEDVQAARRLADVIKQKLGGEVWLDEQRLSPGDAWERDILTAIRRSVGLFVPIISTHTERAEESYVFKEWTEAVDRKLGIPKRRFIVPVIVDEDYEGDPSQYPQGESYFAHFHFGRAPAGDPDEKLAAMLQDEIRAMRRRDAR
jgi:hypothetical protein